MDFSRPGRPQLAQDQPPPPPKHGLPPSYSPNDHSTDYPSDPAPRIVKRRPLSTSIGNGGNIPSGQGQGIHDAGPDVSLKRQSSFETGDDAYLRHQAPKSENWETQPDAGYEDPRPTYLRHPARNSENWETRPNRESEDSRRVSGPPPITQSIPYRQRTTQEVPARLQEPQSAVISSVDGSTPNSRHTSGGSYVSFSLPEDASQPLQYHHRPYSGGRKHSADSAASHGHIRRSSDEPVALSSRLANQRLAPASPSHLGANLGRPVSAYSSTSDMSAPGRTLSPGQFSNGRSPSPSRNSPDSRPMSYIDLLNVPYPQPPPAPSSLDNSHLRQAIGQNASLLSTKKTLDMYRANVKKTNDPTIQYEFAVFMINAAQEMAAHSEDESTEGQQSRKTTQHLDGSSGDGQGPSSSRVELLREARNLLLKLSDRSYPFAQYYLADGYASGLLNKGVEDNDKAFPLFIAASKHGHAEAGYRAALCYEFGWGCRKDAPKAVQFFRQSASKNHPGAMSRLGRACLVGDLGLGNRYREGLKWLKRAAESADFQYNSAPYELGLLHETGFGDDIFRDEAYAAQLFTQSADLGHVEANYRLGDSYEHGKLSCPKDPALSVHFYTRAAEGGHPFAQMALCAWYMVGAEPVLEKDENEAYEWARKAAESGLPKAEYAVGYFSEMGIGCRRDTMESNRWYVRAAEHGDERAKVRLAAISSAASGGGSSVSSGVASSAQKSTNSGGSKKTVESGGRGKKWGLF